MRTTTGPNWHGFVRSRLFEHLHGRRYWKDFGFKDFGLLNREFKDEHGTVHRKKSDAHKAAVVGDTVGDPFKDTAGPSLHVLIKLLATITLVLAPFFI